MAGEELPDEELESEVPMQGGNGQVGDDSGGDIPMDAEEEEVGGGAEGGSQLAADLNALVKSLGLGGGEEDLEDEDDEDDQYEA